MTALTIGSLFSGIGGLEMGLEAALGAETVWQVEQDEYCRKVLAKHWPDADRSVTDVRAATRDSLAGVDIICGGFPCQDISVAGKGAGLDGERSGLWFEFWRVLRDLRPRFAVLENVPAILVRGFGVVLGGLAQLGYNAEWGVLSAEAVAAPHLRRRWFCIAWRPDADRQGQLQQGGPESVVRRRTQHMGGGVPDTQCEQLREQQGRVSGSRRPARAALAGEHGPSGSLAHADRPRREADRRPVGVEAQQSGVGDVGTTRTTPHTACVRRERKGSGVSAQEWRKRSQRLFVAGDTSWWSTEPDVGRVAHGIPSRSHRLRALGNAVVPQCAYEVGLRLRDRL